jgi:hypothetical protein
VEWLECRLSRPGRVGPAEALGLAGMADGMAADVGWEVEALGMAAGVATVLPTAGVSDVAVLQAGIWPHGARAGRQQVSVSERGRAGWKRAVRVVGDGSWRAWSVVAYLKTWRGWCVAVI